MTGIENHQRRNAPAPTISFGLISDVVQGNCLDSNNICRFKLGIERNIEETKLKRLIFLKPKNSPMAVFKLSV